MRDFNNYSPKKHLFISVGIRKCTYNVVMYLKMGLKTVIQRQ